MALMRIYRLWWLLAGVACFVALGCAQASWETIQGPNGPAANITCRRDQSACYEAAGRACPHGYNILTQGGQAGTFVNVNQYGGYAVPVYRGNLLIECKAVAPVVVAPVQ